MKYIIRPGDTLSEIAVRYGVPMSELAAANDIRDINKIYAGQEIEIGANSLMPPGVGAFGLWLKRILGMKDKDSWIG